MATQCALEYDHTFPEIVRTLPTTIPESQPDAGKFSPAPYQASHAQIRGGERYSQFVYPRSSLMTYQAAACIQVGQRRTYVAPLRAALSPLYQLAISSNLKRWCCALSLAQPHIAASMRQRNSKAELEGRCGLHELARIREPSLIYFRTPH